MYGIAHGDMPTAQESAKNVVRRNPQNVSFTGIRKKKSCRWVGDVEMGTAQESTQIVMQRNYLRRFQNCLISGES